MLCFCLFKQKTAYEMRISDWSSDVCSSDLEFLRAFAKRRPRWGWRRAAKELRRAGWKVNNKRVRRLWRDEGLQVPTKTRKKRLSGVGANVGAMSLIAPNALWAMDFQ